MLDNIAWKLGYMRCLQAGFYTILHYITLYYPPNRVLPNMTEYYIMHQYYITKWFDAALEGQNRFYWKDLIDFARCQAGGGGSLKILLSLVNRIIDLIIKMMDKANSTLVFGSFLDARHGLCICSACCWNWCCSQWQRSISSDVVQETLNNILHCKMLFDVSLILAWYLHMFWLIYISACLFNLKESKQSKGLNWVAFAWIPNYDDVLAPDGPIKGLEGLKYSDQEYTHQCLSLAGSRLQHKHWMCPWKHIIRKPETKFYLGATLADHP